MGAKSCPKRGKWDVRPRSSEPGIPERGPGLQQLLCQRQMEKGSPAPPCMALRGVFVEKITPIELSGSPYSGDPKVGRTFWSLGRGRMEQRWRAPWGLSPSSVEQVLGHVRLSFPTCRRRKISALRGRTSPWNHLWRIHSCPRHAS